MRKILLVLIISVLFVNGCAKDEGNVVKNDNLKFEIKTRNETADNINPYENPDIMNDIGFYWIDNNLDLEKALEEGDNIVSFKKDIIYDGKNIEYRAYVENNSPVPFQYTIFMTANNNIQKFMVDKSEEANSYSLVLQAGERKDIHISINPVYAPFGEKGKLKIYTLQTYSNTEELTKMMSENKNNYGAIYNQIKGLGMDEINISADSKENERIVGVGKNELGEDSPKTFIDKQTGIPADVTTGVTLGNKFEKELVEDGLINLNVNCDTKEDMYVRSLCYGEENVRIFLLIDGEIVPAFNGEYFADYYQKTGVVHNILINKNVLPEKGEHIVMGFIEYVDKGSEEIGNVDALYPILLTSE